MDLVINTYGTRIRSTSERLVLTIPKRKEKKEYSVRKIEKIIILVSSSISSDAVQLALEHDIDIVFMNTYGRPVGRIFPSTPKGTGDLRRAQLQFSRSAGEVSLARSLVIGKAENQIRFLEHLQHNYQKDLESFLTPAKDALQKLRNTPERTKEQLFGTEGFIAERYFSAYRELGDFPGRNPRGRDKWNSCLNYGYGILYNEMERACQLTGLDPNMGIHHSERYGKPSLVLDLVEEFRVGVVDSVLFPLLIETVFLRKKNFKSDGDGFVLSATGKQRVLEAIYTRLHEKVFWNGRQQDLKTVFVGQTRALSHFFMDKKSEYVPFSINAIEAFRDE